MIFKHLVVVSFDRIDAIDGTVHGSNNNGYSQTFVIVFEKQHKSKRMAVKLVINELLMCLYYWFELETSGLFGRWRYTSEHDIWFFVVD